MLKESQNPLTQFILLSGFLLSFHFLSFFSTCRGYGLSMALLLFSLSYFSSFLSSASLKHLVICLLAFQLAISANLILVIVMLPLLLILGVIHLVKRQINWKMIFVHGINLLLLYYWISFSLFLQENHALYYGAGESYYKTTYLSLSYLLSGYKSQLIAYAGSALLLATLCLAGFSMLRTRKSFQEWIVSRTVVFSYFITALILGFYLLKKLAGVNYPEDRTGLFLYVFFILFLAYALEPFSGKWNKPAGLLILLLFSGHFIGSLNFRKHSLINYESVPQRFYDTLVREQAGQKTPITIGGHRMRELFYAYTNYRNNGTLNLMDSPDFLNMNADYAVALRNEEKDFSPYYAVIDSEPDWNYVLLKRRTPVRRALRMDLQLDKHMEGDAEFCDLFIRKQDTIIHSQNPILAEFEFSVVNKDVPNRSWIVMQIDTAQDAHYYYKSIPLNWLHYKWDESRTYTYSLISGPLDKKLSTIGFYIYNPNRQQVDIRVKRLRLYELEGAGVQKKSAVLN